MTTRIHVVTTRFHGEQRLYISQPLYEWEHALNEAKDRAAHAMEFAERGVVLEVRHRDFTDQELAELSATEVEDLVRKHLTTKQDWTLAMFVRVGRPA